jgi:hypothetical protein
MADVIFDVKELEQITGHQLSPEIIYKQIALFKKGFPFTKLARACTPGDGINIIQENQFEYYKDIFNKAEAEARTSKFVPASGAASRMFKVLQSFHNDLPSINSSLISEKAGNNPDYKELEKFIRGIKDFACYKDLKKAMADNQLNIDELINKGEFKEIIDHLLNPTGLNYASLPKGLLKFHRYEEHSRTPFEEHLVEGAAYSKDKSGNVKIHFTISPEHEKLVKEYIDSVKGKYEELLQAKYEITYSIQKSSTDTIAVDMDNQPFKDKKGKLVFRPAGHGALIENLNDLNADIVFIKNIDNVVPEHLNETTFIYKKLLGGYLLEIQQQIFRYLKILSASELQDGLINEIFNFLSEKLFVNPPEKIINGNQIEKINFAMIKLNRPLRVCGMVKNTGEPGGGPFWVIGNDKSLSLQLVETSQINVKDPEQKNILTSATHFSPVDLVCGLKDFQGNQFDLDKYIDPETGFISIKSKDGKDLKAMELPGLWNGAMADWNTIFIEVPAITFNPVKTVNDLLRKEHQEK